MSGYPKIEKPEGPLPIAHDVVWLHVTVNYLCGLSFFERLHYMKPETKNGGREQRATCEHLPHGFTVNEFLAEPDAWAKVRCRIAVFEYSRYPWRPNLLDSENLSPDRFYVGSGVNQFENHDALGFMSRSHDQLLATLAKWLKIAEVRKCRYQPRQIGEAHRPSPIWEALQAQSLKSHETYERGAKDRCSVRL